MQEVGENALAAHNQTTNHDARTASGSYAYFAAVRALRDILIPKGWEKIVHKNVEMVAHPETDFKIMVSSGNEDTGFETRTPKTKNLKGKQTKKIVSLNNKEQYLPGMEPETTNISLSHVWMLLFHIDKDKSQMRIELSLPVDMDIDTQRVTAWNTRIIVAPIDFSHTPNPNDFIGGDFKEFEVELKRKSNE